MTIFAEVIKSLYKKEKISSEKVYDFFKDGKLTKEEYLEISRKDGEK